MKKVDRKLRVGQDAAYLCRTDHDVVGFVLSKEVEGGVAVFEI